MTPWLLTLHPVLFYHPREESLPDLLLRPPFPRLVCPPNFLSVSPSILVPLSQREMQRCSEACGFAFVGRGLSAAAPTE